MSELGYLPRYETPTVNAVIPRKIVVSLPATYTAGGFTVNVIGGRILDVIPLTPSVAGYQIEVPEDGKTENSFKVKLYYFDYDAASDGAAIEVPDGASLPSASIGFIVIITYK